MVDVGLDPRAVVALDRSHHHAGGCDRQRDTAAPITGAGKIGNAIALRVRLVSERAIAILRDQGL